MPAPAIGTSKPSTPQAQYAADVEKAALEYLVGILGSEAGRRSATRLGLAMRAIARAAPGVYECDRASVVACVALCALTGLEPGGPFPGCYIIPREVKYKNAEGKWQKRKELHWQVSFRGMLTLAHRAGFALRSAAVYDGDDFDLDLALARPSHRPAEREQAPAWEEMRGVYVVAFRVSDNALLGWEWMPRYAIEARRDRSDAYRRASRPDAEEWERRTPWIDWPEEMSRKTALRFAVSRGLVPLDDVATQHALEADGKGDAIETTATPIPSVESVFAGSGEPPAPKRTRKAIGTGSLDDALAGIRKGADEERERVTVQNGQESGTAATGGAGAQMVVGAGGPEADDDGIP